MSDQLGEQNDPGITTDPIYVEELAPFEESMDFFVRKDVKVTSKDDAEIYGTEALVTLVEGFGKTPGESALTLTDDAFIDGSESFGDRARAVLAKLVQLAKDAFNWIMNIINNQLTRLDNRQFRMASKRKRHGLKTGSVKFPAGVRRLIIPVKITDDGLWIKESLKEVNDFYKGYVKAHEILAKAITVDYSPRDLNDVINKLTSAMGLTGTSRDKDGTVVYSSDVLPGARHFRFKSPTEEFHGTQIYFDASSVEAKLRSDTFEPSGYLIDETLASVKVINEEIRKNQKGVNDLHRELERKASSFMSTDHSKLTAENKAFIQWLINTDKQLSSKVINYVISSADMGLDFVQRGINS